MDDQAQSQLKKQRKMVWFGLFFFGLILLIGIMDGDMMMSIGGGVMTIGAVAALIITKRHTQSLSAYRPGKGFWYYRMSRENKLKYLTGGQILIVILLAGLFWAGYFNWYVLFATLFGLYYIQAVIKPRIKLHTPVDDASLFELEELGIIGPEDIVEGLYKDFESWNDVVSGSKVVVLTLDHLVVIRMQDPQHGERLDIRLREIERVGIVSIGKQGQGMILTVGLNDNSIIRFALSGESFQDSPEQFIQQFLQTLDRLLGNKAPKSVSGPARERPDETPSGAWEQKPSFRHMDLADQPAVSSAGTALPSSGRRMLDF